jgi:trigger factor
VSEPAKAEDFLSLDVRLVIDGKEAWKDGDLAVALADERVLGLPFDLAPEKLVGAAAGAKVSAEVELPMNFRVPEYRGKTATAELEVKDVKRPRLPELDGAFAKRIGEESVEAFRAKVREGLVSEKKMEADNEVRRQILDKLVAATSFELPEKLLARTADRDELRRRYHLQRLGLAGDAMGEEAREELRNVSRQQAERDLRAFLIIEKLAKAKGLDPTDAEVEEHFAGLAARRGADPAALKAHAEEHGEIEVVRSELRERKVMEFILSKAKITEKVPEPEAEDDAEADGAAHGGTKPAKARKPAVKKKPAAKAKK